MANVKVYSYACRLIYSEDAEAVQQQISLTHEHRNLLTEILLEGRKAYRALIAERCGVDLSDLEDKREALLDEAKTLKAQINQWKIQERTRKTNPDLAAKLKGLRKNLKLIKEKIKEVKTKAKLDPELAALLEECDAQVDARIKTARAHFSKERGIYWPNYMRNEESAQQQRYGRMDPRFCRWTGEGTISIQLQGGMSVAELFSGYDSRLRFLAPDGFTDTDPSQTIRGPAKRIRAFWRVASDQNKDPLWIELVVVMHRMLPPDARIKWAILTREKAVRAEGRRFLSLTKDYRYSVQLVTELPDTPIGHDKTVAIRTGWTMTRGALLVATALGSDGKLEQLFLPNRWLADRLKIQNLGSIIDSEANRTLEDLKTAFPKVFSSDGEPEIPIQDDTVKLLREAASGKDNARRLANTLLRLHQADPVMRLLLDGWRTKHLHLLRYKAGVNKRTLRVRLELYRLFVHKLAGRYDSYVLKDFDLRSLTRKDLTKDQAPQEVIWQRTTAAISTLRALLLQRLKPVEDETLLEACERLVATKKHERSRGVTYATSF